MVKHVVRPLTSGISFNCLLPIYAVFSKGFGVFGIFTLAIGDLLPNQALYQSEPHPGCYASRIATGIIAKSYWVVKVFFKDFAFSSAALHRRRCAETD